MCAYHPEVGEQAHTAQESACDDQHDQPYEQSSGTARNASLMNGLCWLWEE